MSSQSIYSSKGQRRGANGVNERVDDHEGCCTMDGSVGDVFGSRFLAKEDEDEDVH